MLGFQRNRMYRTMLVWIFGDNKVKHNWRGASMEFPKT